MYDDHPGARLEKGLLQAMYQKNKVRIDVGGTIESIAEITADVYLLEEDATLPTDGILLDRVVQDLPYGGYYRIPLSHDFAVPDGSRISVVVTQRTGSGDNTAVVEMDPIGSNTYTINFTGENTITDSYAGWTRVKDGSTGHTIHGLN